MHNENISVEMLRKRVGELENWRAHAQVKLTQLRNSVDALASRLTDLEEKHNVNSD